MATQSVLNSVKSMKEWRLDLREDVDVRFTEHTLTQTQQRVRLSSHLVFRKVDTWALCDVRLAHEHGLRKHHADDVMVALRGNRACFPHRTHWTVRSVSSYIRQHVA